MFIYKSHTGVLFTSEHELNHDELYCKQCEESDVFIGSAGTKKEAWNVLQNYCNTENCKEYETAYLEEFINENWEA